MYIPTFKIKIAKIISEHILIFTSELLAIYLALQWIEEVQPNTSVICTDSVASFTSLQSGKSEARQDIQNIQNITVFVQNKAVRVIGIFSLGASPCRCGRERGSGPAGKEGPETNIS